MPYGVCRILAIKAKQTRIAIWSLQKRVTNDLCGDYTIDDPVASKAKGEVTVRHLADLPNVGQAVFGLAEGASPAPSRVDAVPAHRVPSETA